MINQNQRGFTLAEVVISVTIASIIMAVVLWNYSAFNDHLALTSAAQEVAIAIREAQTYGISAKEIAPSQGQFNASYGIYFSPTNPSSYYIFVDINGNKVYDPGTGCGTAVPGTECVEKLSLRNSVVISQICDESACPPNSSATRLDATFTRPNPDAAIYFTNSSNQLIVGPSRLGKVVLASPAGNTTSVEVDNTGEIVIK